MKQNSLKLVVPVLVMGVVYFGISRVLGTQTVYMLPALLLLPFIAGPIAVYFSVRTPNRPFLEAVPKEDETLAPDYRETMATLTAALAQLGFDPSGAEYIRSSEAQKRGKGCMSILQNPITSDIATIMGFPGGASLGFTRYRVDGSRIRTSFSTQRSCFPPKPADDVLRLDGSYDPEWLWMLHCRRVSHDESCARNPIISDAFSYQVHEEFESINTFISSGYWVDMPDRKHLRMTLRGAVTSSFRSLTPSAQIFEAMNRRKLQTVLNTIQFPSHEDYRQSASLKPTSAKEFKRSLVWSR